MRSSTLRKSGLVAAAAAGSALVVIGVPLALAAPTGVPPSDSQGYVDSTARCTKPDTAVIFGSTDTSRVAICKTAAGEYQYRGVRVRDGAKLIATATQASGDTFVVKTSGATYTVSAQALSVTVNGQTYRTETWTDYHGPQAPASGTTKSTSTTTSTSAATSTSATSATSTTAATSATTSAAPSSATTSAPKTSSAPSTSAAPLPPPLPAEAGGGSSGG